MEYSETQKFSLKVVISIFIFTIAFTVLVNLFAGDVDWQIILSVCVLSSLIIGMAFWFLKLDTKIINGIINVKLSPILNTNINRDEISQIEKITYRPIVDFGGWGIRFGKGGIIYNMRGNKAVKLSLKSGKIIYIGTQNPDQLINSINSK